MADSSRNPLSPHAQPFIPSTANSNERMIENRPYNRPLSHNAASFIPSNMSTIQALESIERLGKLL